MASRRSLSAGIASNYAALVAQALFVLVSTPLIIDQAGPSLYGAWTIVLAVRGFLGIADFAIDPAVARFVAAAPDRAHRRAVMSASIWTLAAAGGLTAVAGLAAAGLLPMLIAGTPGLGPALAILAIAILAEMPLNAFAHGLFGLERVWERNGFIVLRYAFAIAALAAVLGAGGELVAIVTAVVAAEICAIALQAAYCLVWVPDLRPSAALGNRERVREIVAFSVPVGGLVLAAGLAFSTGPLVVGGALGAGAAATYGVALRVFDGMGELLARFAEVFLPVFAGHEARGERARSLELLRGGTLASIAVGVPLAGTAIGFGEPLIELWVGDAFGDAWVPLALLAGALAVHAPPQFAVLWAMGAARHGAIARLSLAAAVTATLLAVALVGPLGIDGVALAVLVGLAPFDLWLIPAAVGRELGLRLWPVFLRPLAAAVVLVAPLTVAERLWLAPLLDGSGVGLAAGAGAATLATALAAGSLLRRLPQR